MITQPYYTHSAMVKLLNEGYSRFYIALVLNCREETIRKMQKDNEFRTEGTLFFLQEPERQRLFVLNRFLMLQPPLVKWGEQNYIYANILNFLRVPKEVIKQVFPHAPKRQVAMACQSKYPAFKSFNYELLGINAEEYARFLEACYKHIKDPQQWR